MHFVLWVNDNSIHNNSDGKSYMDPYLTFIIYRREECTFKVTPGYAFRGRVYQPTFVKFSDSITLAAFSSIPTRLCGRAYERE